MTEGTSGCGVSWESQLLELLSSNISLEYSLRRDLLFASSGKHMPFPLREDFLNANTRYWPIWCSWNHWVSLTELPQPNGIRGIWKRGHELLCLQAQGCLQLKGSLLYLAVAATRERLNKRFKNLLIYLLLYSINLVTGHPRILTWKGGIHLRFAEMCGGAQLSPLSPFLLGSFVSFFGAPCHDPGPSSTLAVCGCFQSPCESRR